MRTVFLLKLAILLAAFAAKVMSKPDWDEPDVLKPMGDMTISWVGEKMRRNGSPMSTAEFKANISIDKFEEKYKKWFERKSKGEVLQFKHQGEKVMAAQVGKTFHSIQYRPAGRRKVIGSIVSSIPLPDSEVEPILDKLPPIFEFHGSAELVNKLESIDRGKYADVSTYSFSLPKAYVSRWMRRVLKEKGWAVVSYVNAEIKQLMVQRNSEHAQITIAEDTAKGSGASVVNVVWVKE